SERSVTASEQFAQIVTGNVLHDIAAGLNASAVSQVRAEPDYKRSQRPISDRLWPSGSRRHDAADCGGRLIRGIHRQPLAGFSESRLKFAERHPCFGGRHEIRWFVSHESVHVSRGEN